MSENSSGVLDTVQFLGTGGCHMAPVSLSLEKGVARGGWGALGSLWNTTWQDLSSVA